MADSSKPGTVFRGNNNAGRPIPNFTKEKKTSLPSKRMAARTAPLTRGQGGVIATKFPFEKAMVRQFRTTVPQACLDACSQCPSE